VSASDHFLDRLGYKLVPGFTEAKIGRKIKIQIEFAVYKVRRPVLGGTRQKAKKIFVHTDEPSELEFRCCSPVGCVAIVDYEELPL